MIALAQATDNATLETEDTRRITETDPDFVLLRKRTQRKLMGSVRQLVREAQAARKAAPTQRSGMLNEAVNSFVQRHIALLQSAYEQGHVAGQVDYWHRVSNVPGKQRTVSANSVTLRKRLAFYAPSVAKMAREVSVLAQTPRFAAEPRTAAEFDVVKLYNPNHDAKGRFTYGSNAKTTVAKGKGVTKRGAGGKRESNANAGKSKGYQITDYGGARDALNGLVGRSVTDDEIGSLIGGQKGDSIIIGVDDNGHVYFQLKSAGENGKYTLNRTLGRDANGDLVMQNMSFNVSEASRGQGIGARVFGTEVQTASALGVSRIETEASGHAGDTGRFAANGFYTWAAFGYQASLSSIEGFDRGSMPISLRGARTMQGLMRLPGGMSWWKANGRDWQGVFSLESGSVSRRAWSHYMKTRGIKLAEPSGDQIDFTDEDEKIMEHFWRTLSQSVPDDPTKEDEGAK